MERVELSWEQDNWKRVRGRGPEAEREAPPQLSCSDGPGSSLGVWPKLLGVSPDGGALTKGEALHGHLPPSMQ